MTGLPSPPTKFEGDAVWTHSYSGTGGNDVDREAKLLRWGLEKWFLSVESAPVIQDGVSSAAQFGWILADRNDLLLLHKRLGEELGV